MKMKSHNPISILLIIL